MHILGEREISSLLTGLTRPKAEGILDSLSKALVDYSRDHSSSQNLVHQPLRQRITTAAGHSTLFMPASNTAITGIKVVTRPANGGAYRGSINIYAPEGELIGLLNAEQVTAFRTALATMIPFLKCPFPKSGIVIFGAGKQAEWHVRLALLFAGESIDGITIFSRSAATLNDLKKTLAGAKEKYPGLYLNFVSKEETREYEDVLRSALQRCDAIMCCTPSTSPLFPSTYLNRAEGIVRLSKQRFISLVGSHKPGMQEVDLETLCSGGCVYVDSREACLEEAGEIIMEGITGSKLVEVGEMLSQSDPRSLEGNFVYKCVGLGIMDVVVGSKLLDISKQMGIGRTLEDF